MDTKVNSKDDNTRKKIMEIAKSLFFSSEYNKVTLNEIARQCELTKGGIYHYFNSKDDLLMAVLSESFEDMMDHILNQNFQSLTIEELLKVWFNFRGHLDEISGDENADYNMIFQTMYLLIIAIRKNKEFTKTISNLYSKAIEVLTQVIATAQIRGEIKSNLDPNAVALQLLSMAEGGMLISIIREDSELEDSGNKLFNTVWQQLKV